MSRASGSLTAPAFAPPPPPSPPAWWCTAFTAVRLCRRPTVAGTVHGGVIPLTPPPIKMTRDLKSVSGAHRITAPERAGRRGRCAGRKAPATMLSLAHLLRGRSGYSVYGGWPEVVYRSAALPATLRCHPAHGQLPARPQMAVGYLRQAVGGGSETAPRGAFCLGSFYLFYLFCPDVLTAYSVLCWPVLSYSSYAAA